MKNEKNDKYSSDAMSVIYRKTSSINSISNSFIKSSYCSTINQCGWTANLQPCGFGPDMLVDFFNDSIKQRVMSLYRKHTPGLVVHSSTLTWSTYSTCWFHRWSPLSNFPTISLLLSSVIIRLPTIQSPSHFSDPPETDKNCHFSGSITPTIFPLGTQLFATLSVLQ